ncbi:VOC family protein [Solitalea sp. MAHUQ-68]|uniref:VOC family protein n=1 Tax=Solitalea agri TaxID=2953739 RepID=A0A9X2F0T6_9SPHI|nr:VOC family protein [Solitalea agri]MCO4292542.1 VOC family protein [Solitalea agri]
MDNTNMNLNLTQIAWVVKDIELAKSFFQQMFGISNFSKTMITRLKECDGTYYGEPSDAENYVALAYTDEVFLELIQPISGKSIFKDFIDNNPAGGVQHIAYSTPIANLDKVISDFKNRGFSIISSFDTPIAKIVFFDTRIEIGVFTEIMGITKEGEIAVQNMKTQM